MVKIFKSVLSGEIKAPSSKSYGIRYLILSGLGNKKSTIRNVSLSEDILDSISLLRASGSKVFLDKDTITVEPSSTLNFKYLSLKGSATVYRIALAIGAAYPGKKVISICENLSKRPVDELMNSLNRAGAKVYRDGSNIIIEKNIIKNNIEINANDTSQFVTASIFLSIAKNEQITISIKDVIVSRVYYNITKEIMEKYGIKITEENNSIYVYPRSIEKLDAYVPGDFALSAYFGAIVSKNGNEIKIKNLDIKSGDSKIVDIFNIAGLENKIEGKDWKIQGPARIKSLDVEMKDVPDLVPAVASLISTSNGISHIRKVDHLVFKESNRIKEIIKILNCAGINASYMDGTLTIEGGTLKKFTYMCPNDHRMAMLSISLQATSEGETLNEKCLKKSYPNFIDDFRKLGGIVYES